jgi:hypothetical protein
VLCVQGYSCQERSVQLLEMRDAHHQGNLRLSAVERGAERLTRAVEMTLESHFESTTGTNIESTIEASIEFTVSMAKCIIQQDMPSSSTKSMSLCSDEAPDFNRYLWMS